jgi:hypothetical protein
MQLTSPYDCATTERRAITDALVLLEDLAYRTPPRDLRGLGNVKRALCLRLLDLTPRGPVDDGPDGATMRPALRAPWQAMS